MSEAKWLDRFEVGREYSYREDGAQCVVRVISKSDNPVAGHEFVHLSLECVTPICGGSFGEIDAGSKWTASAALTESGYPNAYAGWSMPAL